MIRQQLLRVSKSFSLAIVSKNSKFLMKYYSALCTSGFVRFSGGFSRNATRSYSFISCDRSYLYLEFVFFGSLRHFIIRFC